MKKIVLVCFFYVLSANLFGQSSYVWSCTRDTTLACSQNCLDLKALIPNINSTSDDYGVAPIRTIAGNCFRAPVEPNLAGNNPQGLTSDDVYSAEIPLPFDFLFYGILYSSLVISTNGVISFDVANAGQFAQYSILDNGFGGLGATGTGPGVDVPDTRYDRAIIMGPYADIQPLYTTSPTRRIKYDIIGTAPNRRFVLSFYKIPLFSTACENLIENTYQITLYEGLGIVDVYVFGREKCLTWNQGRAMIGMQNYDQDKGIMPPGRAASTNPLWGDVNMNEGWRFTPKGGPSAFKRVELFDLAGNLIATGDTTRVSGEYLEASFPNICPTSNATTYIVRSTYSDLIDPTQEITGADTIRVFKTGTLADIAEVVTPAPCGINQTGTVTINTPVGAGITYSSDGVTFVSSNVFTLAPGTYTITAKDASGNCTVTKQVTIASNSTLSATAQSGNTSCPAALDGTITITATQGTPGYTYAVDNTTSFQASNAFTGLAAGPHTVYVKDNAGCVFSFAQQIGSNTGFTTSATAAPTSCAGVANGTITVTVPSQGTTPFTYSIPGFINTPQNSNILTGLAAGSYTVEVKDAAGCTYSFSQAVTNGPGISATFNVINAACSGTSTGQIIPIPSLGATPYTVSQDGINFVPLDTIRNLAAGNYSISVKDGLGCLLSNQPVTVGNNAGITATFTTVNSACNGVSTGKIAILPANGIAPYQYALNGSSTFLPIDTIRNLASGTYTVTVRDAVGCTFTNNAIVVGDNPGITATFTGINASCTGVSNGQIAILPANGFSPYQYSLNSSTTFLPLDTIKNLASGTYTLTVKDAVGCTFTNNAIIVGDNPGITATFTGINASCTGVSNGQIAIQPANGVAPYQFSINNGTSFLPMDTIRNLASGNYTIVIKDNVGCRVTSNPVTVGDGVGVTATAATNNTACAVASTGQIVITTSTGAAPFTYAINGGATFVPLDTIRNLAAGTYSIAVKDNVGCIANLTGITVNANNPGLSATFTGINSACTGVSTGQIVITPTSGVAPFYYSTDGGLTFPVLDTVRNLASGTYNLKVKDALGCILDAPPVTVGDDPGVNATAATQNSACAVASTGQIVVTATAGAAPFTYSIDGGVNFVAQDTFKNLLGTSYNVVVRDRLGCRFNLPPVVVNSNNPGLSATFSAVNSACAGVSTGKIAITPTSGIAPFYYSLDNGATFPQLTDTLRNLASGVYNLKVKDALGCSFDAPPVTVGNDPGVNATAATSNSACAVASTGQIVITPSAGVAPFTYALNTSTTYLPLDTIRNLQGNTYSVTIKDVIGCTFTLPSVVVGSNNPGISATFQTINAACAGVSSGKIAITPTSGRAPFYYSIDGGATFPPLDTIRNLAAGVYNIKVKDALGCAFDAPPVTVSNNLGVTASFSTVNSACATAATGAIIAKPATGLPPFTYTLSPGAVTQVGDSVFRKLSSGAYNIQIEDAAGCIFNSPVQNVGNNPGVLTNASTIQNASCETIPNGSITVNVTAGIAPFNYNVTSLPGFVTQSSNLLSGLFSGSYDIRITDSAGCTKTITSVVGNNPKIKIDRIDITPPTCNGLSNGIVAVEASLGVSPYTYALDLGAFSAANSFNAVAAGPHTVKVADANGCQVESAITVSQPAVLSNTLVSTQKATCTGNPDGQIVVSGAGGTLPYQYTLDAAGLSGYQGAATFNVLAGRYKVTVKDANACTAFVNVTVDSVFNMFLDLGRDTVICSGSSIVLSPNTNAETNLFTYTPAASLSDAKVKNPTATPLDTTKYKLTAQFGICKLTDSIKVSVLRKPIANAGNDVVICNDTTTVLRGSASNLSGAVTYSWSPANLLDSKADSNVVIARPKDPLTTYTLTVKDEYGCNFAVTDDVVVNMLPPVYAFAGNDTNAVLELPHQLYATGAGPGGTYQWYYPQQSYPSSWVNFSSTSIANPTVTFLPVTQPGTYRPDTNYYRLAVTATNAAGCSKSDTVKINVFIGPSYYCPNAFSPNKDGKNDKFTAIAVGMASTEFFRIYNRYGQVVFQTNRFMEGWDGTYKGLPQPVGAYVWVIRGKDRFGKTIDKTGTVMLIR